MAKVKKETNSKPLKAKSLIPSVLSFEKKLVPSDGYMYGTTWEDRKNSCEALTLKTKSVRGVTSHRIKIKKLEAEIESANLQTVDNCALKESQDTLKLHFTLKILGGLKNPSACNSPDFKKAYQERIEEYSTKYGFTELGRRYAMNIANGRFLWRNRVGVEEIEIEVKALNEELKDKTWTFNGLDFSTQNFDREDKNVEDLGFEISEALKGDDTFLMLEITAYAKIGQSQDVYPSQELVLDQKSNNKNGKSKILYEVDGVAAMHSQKIGNAIRTIDTWYDNGLSLPIAVEVYGSVTNLGVAYRKEKNDFYSLLDEKWITNEAMEEEDQHYVLAMFIRGGVFSKKATKATKDDNNKKKNSDGDEE